MKQHTVMTPYMVGEVHYYSTEIDDELVLFDTGPPTAEALAHLERSVDLRRLKHLFVTHCHVDHYGLAAYIGERSGARIHLPRHDVLKLRRNDEWFDGLRALLVSAGFDDGFCRTLLEIFRSPQGHPATPGEFDVAEDCDALGRLGISAVGCPGHSQSDLVYVHDGYAVTGDVLLRDIFQSPLLGPDVLEPSRRFRNYHAYCASIAQLSKLKGLTILPAHREFVAGVDETILFYVRKLLERAGQVKRYAELEKVSDILKIIFGSPADPVTTYIKASEIYFMRDFLADPLRLKIALEQAGLFPQMSESYEAVTA